MPIIIIIIIIEYYQIVNHPIPHQYQSSLLVPYERTNERTKQGIEPGALAQKIATPRGEPGHHHLLLGLYLNKTLRLKPKKILKFILRFKPKLNFQNYFEG